MLPIKVLIVDDSIVFRELLVQNLGRDPAIQVVGTARDPFEARDAILALKPDVMTLDIELPRMNGIEFLRKLMPQYPLPVVVISSLSDKVFDAMNAGAVDFVAKPAVSSRKQLEDFVRNELLVKIKIASSARISNIKKSVMLNHANPERMSVNRGNLVVAIGASTGRPPPPWCGSSARISRESSVYSTCRRDSRRCTPRGWTTSARSASRRRRPGTGCCPDIC